MQRLPTLVAILLVVLMLVLPHGSALHCNGDITPVDAGGQTLYLEDRSETAGQTDHWLYLESNGMAGLQSGSNPLLPCPEPECGETFPFWFGDPCDHLRPDTLLL